MSPFFESLRNLGNKDTGRSHPVEGERGPDQPDQTVVADLREPEHSGENRGEPESPTAGPRELDIFGRGEERKVVYFGDLSLNEKQTIMHELRIANFIQPFGMALQKVASTNSTIVYQGCNEGISEQFATVKIRTVTDQIRDQRPDVISILRRALPVCKGVFGPLLHPKSFIEELGYKDRSNLEKNLSGNAEAWKMVAEKMGVDRADIRAIDNQRGLYPAAEVLKKCQFKARCTIGYLYEILVEGDMEILADKF
ncbi:uncharacterized protein LOC111333145 isoform X2 [Stylophora pistillata]|uniref:uncharacterized protein LOC111333145 isoform X2 n=1 Tax=Stylophora pistillata TaxID=50429 RepID=UPI000C048287|nr:uncharacterized protein LOC111333145 isoform X2 [Stylophora pistillata]